jgi:hypothetical protein
MKLNKKGQFVDLVMLGVVFFVITLTIVFGSLIWNKVLQGARPSLDNDTYNTGEDMRVKVTGAFDYFLPTAVIFTGIGMILLAKYTNANPIWYALAIIFMIFSLFIGVIMKDTLLTVMSSDAEIYATYEQFTITNWLVNNMLYVILGIGVIMAIVMYISSPQGVSRI